MYLYDLKLINKAWVLALIAAFLVTSVSPLHAREVVVPALPAPATLVNLSPSYTPAHLQGLKVHPDNALQFDFFIHKGEGNLTEAQKKEEYAKLVKYFLASLTIPDKDQWVNLSPYEKDRTIEGNFGKTEMGRDLLSQDYLLKQITSSLMYPESGLGKGFWDKVYQKAYQQYGHTNIPINTFNKVWIVPDEAVVYESGNSAYILKSHLKVMLEEDYLALNKNVMPAKAGIQNIESRLRGNDNALMSKTIRQIILPELEREVNEGKNFAPLRQIVSGMLLAVWYKKALKESLLGKVYADKAKVKGIDQNPKNNDEIYQQYLTAFKKGVYNYIKEDTDAYTRQSIPRKYFAGGFKLQGRSIAVRNRQTVKPSEAMLVPQIEKAIPNIENVRVDMAQAHSTAAVAHEKDPADITYEDSVSIGEQKISVYYRRKERDFIIQFQTHSFQDSFKFVQAAATRQIAQEMFEEVKQRFIAGENLIDIYNEFHIPTVTDPEAQKAYYRSIGFDHRGVDLEGSEVVLSDLSTNRSVREAVAAKILSEVPSGRVLSIGEGRGHLGAILQKRGLDFEGIDITPKNVRFAHARGVHVKLASAYQLSYLNDSFDAVIFHESLGAMDPQKSLTEAWRVLKPGGKLMFTFKRVPL